MTAQSNLSGTVAERPAVNPIVRQLPAAGRVLLGLVFFVFGLNGFLHFIPSPPVPGGAGEFLGSLVKSGYMIPFIKTTEVLAGVLLLSNRFVPLALAIIAPIILNIVAFHIVLAPGGVALGLAALVLEVYLAWSYRDVFRPMLAKRVTVKR